MTPAEMLDAAMDGKLELDSDQLPEQQLQNEPANNPNTENANTEQADPATQQGEQTSSDEETKAPIASKSGEYTIPYEKLEAARNQAKTIAGENEQLRQQLAELTTRQQANLEQAIGEAQGRADAGQQQTQADKNLQAAQSAIESGVDVSVFGDFTEESIAKGVFALMAQQRDAMRAELKAEIEREFAPVKAIQAKEQSENHINSIYAKHPDASEIVQSEQFANWQQSLPTFVRSSVQAVIQGGSAEQVIEVFDTFKAQAQAQAKPEPNAQGRPKAPEVQRYVPNSLSEVAGEPHKDVVQQTMATASNPAALLEAMQGMSSEQIERLMNAVPA